MKKLIVFDLDGTLAESKSALDPEMSGLLHDLLGIVKVAVISGGGWPQFEKQVVAKLPHDERLRELGDALQLRVPRGQMVVVCDENVAPVYAAEEPTIRKRVAIKVLRRDFAEDAKACARQACSSLRNIHKAQTATPALSRPKNTPVRIKPRCGTSSSGKATATTSAPR